MKITEETTKLTCPYCGYKYLDGEDVFNKLPYIIWECSECEQAFLACMNLKLRDDPAEEDDIFEIASYSSFPRDVIGAGGMVYMTFRRY